MINGWIHQDLNKEGWETTVYRIVVGIRGNASAIRYHYK